MILVFYTAVDGFSKRGSFKTLADAQQFAQEWVGRTPELAPKYAISGDGIGKIRASVPIVDLFPALKAQEDEFRNI